MKRFFIFLLVMFLSIAAGVYSAASKDNVVGSEIMVTELTRSNIIARINTILDQNMDIRAFTPELKQEKTKNDTLYYTYRGKRIEGLNKTSLLELFRNINQQLAWKDFKKLQKQDKMLKNLKKISKMPRTQKAR